MLPVVEPAITYMGFSNKVYASTTWIYSHFIEVHQMDPPTVVSVREPYLAITLVQDTPVKISVKTL